MGVASFTRLPWPPRRGGDTRRGAPGAPTSRGRDGRHAFWSVMLVIRTGRTCNLVANLSPCTAMRNSRSVSWLRAARKDFEAFPAAAQDDVLDALSVAAEGGMSAKAKPFKGVEGGVFEIAARHRGDAFRAIYAVKIDVDIWVIHAFQKKSKSGIKTPMVEVELIRERLKRLTEALK
jgi:phage-related protein